jgi:AraC-like DNA-binding protein
MVLPSAPSFRDEAPPLSWPAVLAAGGPGFRSELHAHHLMHVVLARRAPIRVRLPLQPTAVARGVLTGPDSVHALDARGAEVLIAFVDPESSVGRRLAGVVGGTTRLLDDGQVDQLWSLLEGDEINVATLTRWGERAVEVLAQAGGKPRSMHPRVRVTIKFLDNLQPGQEPSLDELAGVAGLSPGRFTHAFAESMGVPLRTYLLWRKLRCAVLRIAAGHSPTNAAIDAGFADTAHLSRTFRRMFGTTLSEMRRSQMISASIASSGMR